MQASTESAVVLKATTQTPLLIDPSGQAAAWIVRHETARAAAAVETTTMRNPRFATTLELAVRFGKVRSTHSAVSGDVAAAACGAVGP